MDDERPEWESLLAALAEAEDTFTFLELGAGYGRWTTRAHTLAVERGLRPILVAVEAEPHHFAALKVATAAIPVKCIHAAVSHRNGWAPFGVGIDGCYGQKILTRPRAAATWLLRGGRIRIVPRVTLDSLLDGRGDVDLIDLDVQGAEADILEHADLARVRRVHIGTHSREIEARLRTRFGSRGWVREHDYAGDGERATSWGPILFQDGAQTWLNPAHAGG